MVFEWIMSAVAAAIGGIGDLFPTFTMPGWWSTITGHVSTVVGSMAPLNVWLPFGAVGNALLFVLAAAGVAVGIKLIRIVASFVTMGGGSAA